jgi:peptidoglycan/xylan/chitin deacetylase (PgdA/CDA1 family)
MSFLNSVVAPVLFPSILWHSDKQAVHITFDDGPHPLATPRVLSILEKRNVHATFFLVGANVRRYPDIASEIVRRGHTIGNHGQNHRPLIFKSLSLQRQEIQLANESMKDILNLRPKVFRPPFGYFDARTLRLVRSEGQKVVMWDIDTHDYSTARPDRIAAGVSKHAKQGSIVLFHDNENTASIVEQYLAQSIDRLSERGFDFSALTL